MTIELNDITYVWAIWFAAWPDYDYLAILYQQEGQKVRLFYRFRYDAAGDKSEEVRSFGYEATFPATAQGLEAHHDSKVFDLFKGDPLLVLAEKVDVRGNGDLATHLLLQQPWAHIKSISELAS